MPPVAAALPSQFVPWMIVEMLRADDARLHGTGSRRSLQSESVTDASSSFALNPVSSNPRGLRRTESHSGQGNVRFWAESDKIMLYPNFEMRAVTNSLLPFLLVGALVWGNCFCCPQLPLSPASEASSHDCCDHPGKQPVPSQRSCHSVGLRHFVKIDPAPQTQLRVVAICRVAVAGTPPISPIVSRAARLVIPRSLPDLEVLNSNIRT
jgi:hypothetical protein